MYLIDEKPVISSDNSYCYANQENVCPRSGVIHLPRDPPSVATALVRAETNSSILRSILLVHPGRLRVRNFRPDGSVTRPPRKAWVPVVGSVSGPILHLRSRVPSRGGEILISR